VAIVIDASGSMKRRDPQLISKVAAKLFVDLVGPEDEVGIVEFGQTAQLLGKTHVTGDEARQKLHGFIDRVGRNQECTDYRLGFEKALEMFPRGPAGTERRLIIFLTDGVFDPIQRERAYYDVLTEDEKKTLFPLELQKLLDKEFDSERMKKDLCPFPELEPASRAGFKKRFAELVEKELVPRGVKTYAIGFGNDLAKPDPRSAHKVKDSIELLGQLAEKTKGKALIESDVSKVPGFFSEIFASLVGAPVDARPEAGQPEAASYSFEIIKGTRAAAVVVPTTGDRAFAVELVRVEGGAPKPVPADKLRVRSYNETVGKGEVVAGYRFYWIQAPEPGTYRIAKTAGKAPTFKAQILLDVGLTLAPIEAKLEPRYPQTAAGELSFSFGLRTASGDKVAGLSKQFMSDMRFAWKVLAKGKAEPLAQGKPTFDASNPMAVMKLSVPWKLLPKGEYELEVQATHQKGFFELNRLLHPFVVYQLFETDVAWKVEPFDLKTQKGIQKKPWIVLGLTTDLEVPQRFQLDLSGIPNRKLLRLELSNPTEACAVVQKQVDQDRVEICLHRKDQGVRLDLDLTGWSSAKDKGASFAGPITLTALQPERFKGRTQWETRTAGKVGPWELKDFLRANQAKIITVGFGFLIVLLLLGFFIKGRFPPQAMLYYRELGDTSDPTPYRLGQRAKSFLPWVSSSHAIGGQGSPRSSGAELCRIRARLGGNFRIEPGSAPVSFKLGDETQETRTVIDGRWGTHYTAGDRYELWLTRTPE
jgi:hypothetical protein